MDHSQLSSLKRSQLQQLARRESFKASLKNVVIIRLLLEKYPDGVPKLIDEPSASKPFPSSLSKARQPTRKSKQKPRAKSELPSIEAEGTNPNLQAESTIDESDVPPKEGYVRAMAPPPATPAACSDALWPSAHMRLPKTPRLDTVFEPQAEGEPVNDEDAQDTGSQPETTPTSHQAHGMLRRLTNIIDTVSLNPEEPSSILYRAKALNTILDTTIVPRMMKVDKDVNDIVWMRAAVEKHLGPRFKEKGILPKSRHDEVADGRSDLSFPAPRPPPPKRRREEGGGQGVSPLAQPCALKRTRIQ